MSWVEDCHDCGRPAVVLVQLDEVTGDDFPRPLCPECADRWADDLGSRAGIALPDGPMTWATVWKALGRTCTTMDDDDGV